METKNSLEDIQELVDKWIREHGGYWPSLSMVCAIMEELGEVAREINSLEGYKPTQGKYQKTIRPQSGQGGCLC